MKSDSTSNYDWMFGPGKPIPGERTPLIRKGNICSWKEHFIEEQSKLFDEIYQITGVDLVSAARPSGKRRSGDYGQHSVDGQRRMLALQI